MVGQDFCKAELPILHFRDLFKVLKIIFPRKKKRQDTQIGVGTNFLYWTPKKVKIARDGTKKKKLHPSVATLSFVQLYF